ncbi:hypothetical protein VTN31DRAFT_3949 [Thermomyces dupontii]|uniref:uncharacterized protein n=1 Tax=Talaromyces thermophilus TaxID=28565 RepID=UPI003743C8C1
MSQSGRSSWDEFGGTGECALASAPCPGSTPVVPEPPSGGRSIATATLPPADRPCLSVATSDFLPSSEPVARSPEFDGSSLVTPASRGFTTHGRSPSLIARDLHTKGPGIVTISTTPSTKSSGVPGPRDSQKASKNACSSTGATRASTTGPSRSQSNTQTTNATTTRSSVTTRSGASGDRDGPSRKRLSSPRKPYSSTPSTGSALGSTGPSPTTVSAVSAENRTYPVSLLGTRPAHGSDEGRRLAAVDTSRAAP